MPAITFRRELESCLDNAPQCEYELGAPVDEALMRKLAVDATLQYFPHFPRPYFRIDRPRAYVLQGIVGRDRIRAAFVAGVAEEAERELRDLIEGS